MSNPMDILKNKKWDQLITEEKENIVFHYRENGKFQTAVVSKMSDILFNWLFILNSGGLLSIVTIFASSNNKLNLIILCLLVGSCFIVGLLLISLAALLEHYRHKKNGELLDQMFDSIQNGEITVGNYLANISKFKIPAWLIALFQTLSFLFFCGGITIGFYLEYLNIPQ
jgi:hypothetical protein